MMTGDVNNVQTTGGDNNDLCMGAGVDYQILPQLRKTMMMFLLLQGIFRILP